MTARAGAAPLVVVVVLNWCGHDDTAACIESLLRSRYPSLRILLVDNGSPDGSGDRLHAAFPDVPYLQTGANLGYTGGNNRGFEWADAAGADYVFVLNNDTIVEPDCIGLLVDAAESGARIGGVAPKILYHDAPEIVWYAGGDFSSRRALGRHRGEGRPDADTPGAAIGPVSFLTGCAFLIPMPVLREVGGFAEEYFAYVEDAELSVRLRRAGYAMLYVPAARVHHRIAIGVEQNPSPWQIRQRDRNRRRLVARHYGPLERLRFTAWFVPTRLVHLARYLVTGDRPRARAIWDGAFGR